MKLLEQRATPRNTAQTPQRAPGARPASLTAYTDRVAELEPVHLAAARATAAPAGPGPGLGGGHGAKRHAHAKKGLAQHR